MSLVILLAPAQASSSTIANEVSSFSTAYSSQRKIVRDTGGDLFAVYLKKLENYTQVYLSKSIDNGTVWQDVGRVSEGNFESVRVTIATDREDQLHIFWTKFISAYGQIFYRTYGRERWSVEYQLTTGPAYSGFPSAAFDSKGRLHLVWYGYDGVAYQVFYTRFDGLGWATPVKLSRGFPDSVNPTIAVDSRDNLHVAWYKSNGRYYQINYVRWSGGWGGQIVLSSATADAFNPSVAIDSKDNVYLVWDEGKGPQTRVYYRVLRGESWSRAEALTSEDVSAETPTVAADAQGTVYVLYNKSDGQIYIRKYSGQWSAEEKLTTSGENTFPSLRWSFNNNPMSGGGGKMDYVWTSKKGDLISIMYGGLPISGPDGMPTPSGPAVSSTGLALVAATSVLVLLVLRRFHLFGTEERRAH